MRVLWFTNTPSNYSVLHNSNNGGGWISSLEYALCQDNEVELGICFMLDGQPWKLQNNGVCYYPVPIHKCGGIDRIKRGLRAFFCFQYDSPETMRHYLKVIEDFKPDLIHIFGTEQDFGLMTLHTKIPVVIHLQGILIPCLNAFFPPGMSRQDYLFCDLNPWNILKRYLNYRYFRFSAQREYKILKVNNHYLGRTEWDKAIVRVFNHQATYDYCSEILRDAFYLDSQRVITDRLIITSTISSPLYKGMDMVGKCADILYNEYRIDFEWRVFGNIDINFFRRQVINKMCRNQIKLMGVAAQDEIRQSILESTVFVHPSYIDNSPNSVCEAQILGCPIVAQNVGGLSSIVSHEDDGILVPANDPYLMADAIIRLFQDNELNIQMGRQSQIHAQARHDKATILRDIKWIYRKYTQL